MDWYGARWGWYIGIEKGINNYEREREREICYFSQKISDRNWN